MLDIFFKVVFPLVLLGFIIIIFISGLSNKNPKHTIMSFDEFVKDWLKDHGQAHKVEEQFAKMKKDPSGALYMPLTYKGAKIFIKWGLTPNKVSYLNLILSFLIFYGVIMAGEGHHLDLRYQQPYYGIWFLALGFLVLFTGIIDGIDGAIARLLDIKSKSGAWLDNVIDRISDVLLLICLIPGSFLVITNYGLDFTWIVWINIFLIFIYEYMRARHEGLGLLETKPYAGERVTRILIIGTCFLIYGISSFMIVITDWINPSATVIWTVSHYTTTTWCMLIFQVILLGIMTVSSIQLARYSFKQLKKMDDKSKK
ncbi:MAG: CDP-alcohol phosphatidyltransferase family protein [Promethearchaeota archaeon]